MPSIWEKHITTLEIEIKNKDSTDEYYITVCRKISKLIQEWKTGEELINKPIPKFFPDPKMEQVKNEVIYLHFTNEKFQLPSVLDSNLFNTKIHPFFRRRFVSDLKEIYNISETKVQDHLFWIEGQPQLKNEVLKPLLQYQEKWNNYMKSWRESIEVAQISFHASKLLQRVEMCSMNKLKNIADYLYLADSNAKPFVEIALEMIQQNQIESALEIHERFKNQEASKSIIVEVCKKYYSINGAKKALDFFKEYRNSLSRPQIAEIIFHICNQSSSIYKLEQAYTLINELSRIIRLYEEKEKNKAAEIVDNVFESALKEKEYKFIENVLKYDFTYRKNFDILIKLLNSLIQDHKIYDAKLLIKKYNDILSKTNYYQSIRLLNTYISLRDTDATWNIIHKYSEDQYLLAIAKTAFQKHFFNEEAEKVDQLIASIKK